MEMRPRFIVSFDRLEKPGIEPTTLVYNASEVTTATLIPYLSVTIGLKCIAANADSLKIKLVILNYFEQKKQYLFIYLFF